MHLVRFRCFQPRHHHHPPSTTHYTTSTHRLQQTNRVTAVPWYGGLYTVYTVVGTYSCGLVQGGACFRHHQPDQNSPPSVLRSTRPPSSAQGQARAPNCPPNLRPRPITSSAKSYRWACYWTAAAGHHAIPAAMWTVSLVKSNHLSGKQPGPGPALESSCSVVAAPQGKFADLPL